MCLMMPQPETCWSDNKVVLHTTSVLTLTSLRASEVCEAGPEAGNFRLTKINLARCEMLSVFPLGQLL